MRRVRVASAVHKLCRADNQDRRVPSVVHDVVCDVGPPCMLRQEDSVATSVVDVDFGYRNILSAVQENGATSVDSPITLNKYIPSARCVGVGMRYAASESEREGERESERARERERERKKWYIRECKCACEQVSVRERESARVRARARRVQGEGKKKKARKKNPKTQEPLEPLACSW